MMNRILIFCVLMMLISSCSGMNSKRSQKSDEFLIQKKNPLVMPPDIDDLPKPKKSMDQTNESSEINLKKVIKTNDVKENDTNTSSSSSLSESIIKKLKNNEVEFFFKNFDLKSQSKEKKTVKYLKKYKRNKQTQFLRKF